MIVRNEEGKAVLAFADKKVGRKNFRLLVPITGDGNPTDQDVEGLFDYALSLIPVVKKQRKSSGKRLLPDSPINKLAIAMGGLRSLAKNLEVHETALNRWKRGISKPYQKYVVKMEALAVQHGIDDFIV